MNVTEKIVLGREENIVGKGENTFKRLFFQGQDCV